jgi:ubiquinone/menaquinone biosynthesis C-methylase UbiE
MTDLLGPAALIAAIGLGAWLVWWLFFETEGVYLGRRVVIWLYNLYAGRYDRIKRFHAPHEHAYVAQPILEAIAPLKHPLVLDAAAGTCRTAIALFRHAHFQGRVINVELSRPMLLRAVPKLDALLGERADDRAPLLWCPAETLPFPNATFDVVTCLEALEFMERPRAVLEELIRVLRPGGLLVTTLRISTRLMPGKAWKADRLAEALYDLGCSDVVFETWQVDYDRVLAWKDGESPPMGARPLVEVLRCPVCGQIDWERMESALTCAACGTSITVRDGIIALAPLLTG